MIYYPNRSDLSIRTKNLAKGISDAFNNYYKKGLNPYIELAKVLTSVELILEAPTDGSFLDGLLPLTVGMKLSDAIDEINEALLPAPPTFAISSFVCSPSTNPLLIGTGTWKNIGALVFSASYNLTPTGAYISHSPWTNLAMTGTGLVGPTASLEAVAYPSVGGSKSFTLHATDGIDPTTATINYNFVNKRFWGVSVYPDPNESQIEILSNELSNEIRKTFTVNAGAGEYIIYAYPSRLGEADIWVGGFMGGFVLVRSDLSITNGSGFTETYRVYKSENVNLGNTTVTVVPTGELP